jgi:PAS domain S-box-containing protein
MAIVRHLPLFAVGWLTTTVAWGLALILESRLSLFPATLLFVFQLGVLIAAVAICHSGASGARAPLVVLAACLLIALSSSGLFAAIGGYAEMLGFVLLTLFLAASPLFAWSGRAALVLLIGTLIPWILAIPFLEFFLRPAELALAIATGAMVGLTTLMTARRNARVAEQALESSETYRGLVDGAPDMIFSVDLADRFTYVNDALARFLGEPPEALIGRSSAEHLSDAAGHGDLHALLRRAASGEEMPSQVYEVRSAIGARTIETACSVIRALDGRVIRIRGSARDVTMRLAAEKALHASLEELRKSEAELRKAIAEQPAVGARTDPTDIIGFDVQAPDSEERASVALLRKPLATLKDEEVRSLKEEVDRLRKDVRQHQADVERQLDRLVEREPRRPRGRPRKALRSI